MKKSWSETQHFPLHEKFPNRNVFGQDVKLIFTNSLKAEIEKMSSLIHNARTEKWLLWFRSRYFQPRLLPSTVVIINCLGNNKNIHDIYRSNFPGFNYCLLWRFSRQDMTCYLVTPQWVSLTNIFPVFIQTLVKNKKCYFCLLNER